MTLVPVLIVAAAILWLGVWVGVVNQRDRDRK